FLALIRAKRDRQIVLVAEFVLRLDRVGRNADDFGLSLGKGALEPAERDRFRCATRRVGLGIEKQHEFAAFEVGERNGAATVTRQRKTGGFFPDTRDGHVPSFRRFRRVNVTADEAPVKGWWSRGNSRGSRTCGPAGEAPEFEVGDLEREGKSGCA